MAGVACERLRPVDLAFARTVAWRVFATGGNVVSGLVTLRLMSKHVSKPEYAVVGAALGMMMYLPLLDGGFRMVVNRRLLAARSLDSNDQERINLLHFSQSLQSWVGIVALSVSVLLMGLYALTPNARAAHESWLFYLMLGTAGAMGMLAQMQATLLTGLGRQAQVFAINGFASLGNLALLALCFHQGLRVWAFPVSLLIGATLQFLAAGYLARLIEPGLPLVKFRRDSAFRQRLAGLKSEALAAFRSQASILLLFSFDIVLVGLVPQQDEAATYMVLTRIFAIVRNCLQAASEAMWPLVASGHDAARRFEQPLLRLNAWICGAALGACVPSLPPFLEWLMKKDWSPSPLLVVLFAARFCVTTFSSPSAFFLLGRGDFKTLARYVERELAAAVVLSVPLGWKFGPTGVVLSFLLATAFGTLTPILFRYAALVKESPFTLVGTVWSRGVAAAGVAGLIGWLIVQRLQPGPLAIGAGAAAAVAGVLPGMALAWFRRPANSGLSRTALVNMLRNF